MASLHPPNSPPVPAQKPPPIPTSRAPAIPKTRTRSQPDPLSIRNNEKWLQIPVDYGSSTLTDFRGLMQKQRSLLTDHTTEVNADDDNLFSRFVTAHFVTASCIAITGILPFTQI